MGRHLCRRQFGENAGSFCSSRKRNVRFSFGLKLVSNEILAVRKIKNGMYGLTQPNEKRVGPLIVQRSKTDEMSQVTITQERSPALRSQPVQVGRQILAGGSLLRSGQTQVGEPKIGEHAK
jgi:hypothetical protein